MLILSLVYRIIATHSKDRENNNDLGRDVNFDLHGMQKTNFASVLAYASLSTDENASLVTAQIELLHSRIASRGPTHQRTGRLDSLLLRMLIDIPNFPVHDLNKAKTGFKRLYFNKLIKIR